MSQPLSSYVTPPFAGIATFGRRSHTRELAGVDVAIVGVPYDGSTSYRSGARFGPRAIREQSLLLWGYNNALQVSPFDALTTIDYGDVQVVPMDVRETHQAVEREVGGLISAGCKVLTLGGDHSISLPLLRAHHRKYGPLAVVHFDAHPDTWDEEFPGHKFSHGTPFIRALEEGLIDTQAYLQVGIRGSTPASYDYDQAIKAGARMITLDEALDMGIEAVIAEIKQRVGSRAVYLTFDIDAVDPAFAPGTGTPEVGGFTSVQALRMVRGLQGLNLIGCDLVEVSPPFDSQGITAILAANLAFEFLSLMARQKQNLPT
jgi:agmatinase